MHAYSVAPNVASRAQFTPDPTEVGRHSIPRTGAPPIRVTGRQIYAVHGRYGHAITLWSIRSPGFVLAYRVQLPSVGEHHAQRVANLADAATVLEACCKKLATQSIEALPNIAGSGWEDVVGKLQTNGRVEDFRILTGRTIADWVNGAWSVAVDPHLDLGAVP